MRVRIYLQVFSLPLGLVTLLGACEGRLDDASSVVVSSEDPGRVVLHRLNRTEYNNTVRDLLGTTQTPADEFPLDGVAEGFDNIAQALTMSPLLFEQYETSARLLVEELLGAPPIDGPNATTNRWEAESLMGTVGAARDDVWNLWTNGSLSVQATVVEGQRYNVTVRAYENHGGNEFAHMTAHFDDELIGEFDVSAVRAAPETYQASFVARFSGTFELRVSYTNDTVSERDLFVDWIDLSLGEINMTPSEDHPILICSPETEEATDCGRRIIQRFAGRAYRRPAHSDEVDRLMQFFAVARENGGDWIQGLRLAAQAILLSPHFLFRVEIDETPDIPRVHRLSAYELASRLSYFLWSSMPDEALLARAADGTLLDPAIMVSEVERMLADPKAQEFSENFVGQWLTTRNLTTHAVAGEDEPRLSASLRTAMAEETRRYFDIFLRGDRPMSDFLTADVTVLNDELRQHYGMPSVGSNAFSEVSLSGTDRRGILTHASVLTVTSHPNRTSPVKRGAFVLTRLLCAPPPPPANVEGFAEATGGVPLTLRDRLEQHRADPQCASCHQLMDPIGLGLENFDLLGGFRTIDPSGLPIDASATLVTGEPVYGAISLSQAITTDERFLECVTTQMATYATGRAMGESDRFRIRRLTRRWQGTGYLLPELITEIVLSDMFQTRRPS